MKSVLVIGSGGREHALAWKLSQSPSVGRVIVAPGNDGMPEVWERWPVSLSLGKLAFQTLAERALQEKVELTVVGPDNPLADGIVDVFEAMGLVCFGPRAGAAKIEASKSFAKNVMNAAHVPTPEYWLVESVEEAQKLLKSVPWSGTPRSQGWVLKADGLAFGKGVYVCKTLTEALEAVPILFKMSSKLVIEQQVFGEELSWMAFCDGESCSLLEPARDFKRLQSGDLGPNTGGMGAISPVPNLPQGLDQRIETQVFLPVLKEMKNRGIEFRGLLYAGLMWDRQTDRFWVLEFNSRFGDPETQVLMPRMDGDLFDWCWASACGELNRLPRRVPFKNQSAVYVVAAAPGYPDFPEKGIPIRGVFPQLDSSLFFFSGVNKQNQIFYTEGGRVLGALGLGSDLAAARLHAYQALKKIQFRGMQFRDDI